MKVLFTIAGLHPESGGPARSVPALGEALAKTGIGVEILSLDYGKKFDQPESGAVPVTFVNCSAAWFRRLRWSPRFKTILREHCRTAGIEIVHDTGLWLSTNHAAAVVSRELKLPRIVSPRGMLTRWSLRHKGWKKRIAWQLYQRHNLQSAQLLHATSPAEVEDFRAVGLRQPIAMIPNGVRVPFLKSEIKGQRSQIKTLLFLSRIHPKKGLLNLVQAWAAIIKSGNGNRKSENWKVVIAGTDEDSHLNAIKSEVRRLRLEGSFEFVGAVDGEAKWILYRQADLFVLPSHSENFGIVIAEALACGLPVITTRGTPWEDLITHRCGWWVEMGAKPLADALAEAMALSKEERQAMGLRGRKLVEENYTWPAAAKKMRAVYEWMLGDGVKPEWVV